MKMKVETKRKLVKVAKIVLRILILMAIIFLIGVLAYLERGYFAIGGELFLALGAAFSPIWMKRIEWVEG